MNGEENYEEVLHEWQKKLNFLQSQEVKVSDPSIKFTIENNIKECREKINYYREQLSKSDFNEPNELSQLQQEVNQILQSTSNKITGSINSQYYQDIVYDFCCRKNDPDDPDYDSGVVPFIGAGINLYDCSLPISPMNMALNFLQHDMLTNLTGVPCAFCPGMFMSNLPDDCPIRKKIAENDLDINSINQANANLKSSLFTEQDLIFAKLNLRLVAQYIKLNHEHNFYEIFHQTFDEIHEKCQPNAAHHFLAQLPKIIQNKGYRLPYQLILTTNYDELLERAFLEAKQPYHLIYYVAEGDRSVRGRFKQKNWEQIKEEQITGQRVQAPLITKDKEEEGESPDFDSPWEKYPIILKMYGTWADKFVITEEHHLNYLSYFQINEVLPSKLLNILTHTQNSLLLFGYSHSDFDLHIIWDRFAESQSKLRGKVWMISQSKLGTLEDTLWRKRNGKLINSPLSSCINHLDQQIEAIKAKDSRA